MPCDRGDHNQVHFSRAPHYRCEYSRRRVKRTAKSLLAFEVNSGCLSTKSTATHVGYLLDGKTGDTLSTNGRLVKASTLYAVSDSYSYLFSFGSI